ncbi:hypothetical protein Holit_00494 [Hollandina sp. SP2]
MITIMKSDRPKEILKLRKEGTLHDTANFYIKRADDIQGG